MEAANEGNQLIWKSKPSSMVSMTVGRVMNNLLSARPKKLEDAISRLSPESKRGSLDSLEESLWFLSKFVKDAAERKEALDEILVPMIENSLKYKESKHGGQEMIILNWLFQDEPLFQALSSNLASIIAQKEDRFISFGWCTLIRKLVEFETHMNQCLTHGMRERHWDFLKILCTCISHLSRIACTGSAVQSGFELPSRLSVSAADCCLAITQELTKKAEVSSDRRKSSKPSARTQTVSLVPAAVGEKKVKPGSKLEVPSMEMQYLLWDHLADVISLLQKLLAWSRKSRPLHSKGLEQVLKWLQGIREHYSHLQNEAGSKIINSGVLLLSSCWKHYSKLLYLEDRGFSHHYKELLEQYLSGIQFYTDNHTESAENAEGGMETRKFFLNCLCLLLGRLDSKKLAKTLPEFGVPLSQVLLSQLRCNDEDVIEVVAFILQAVIFEPKFAHESGLSERRHVDAVIPVLIHLLDERDGAARAVVMLIAEYCIKSVDNQCLEEVLKRLASENDLQRRNAVDIISEIIHVSSISESRISHLPWRDIADHLLERLEDEESAICEKACNLLPLIDPSLVLAPLVSRMYSMDHRAQSSAGDALVRLLKYHNQNTEVIYMLLDSLSACSQNQDLSRHEGVLQKGSIFDNDKVLRSITEWSKSVGDWSAVSGPLIDKLFAEPSNAVIVRFLSCTSEQLATAAEVVLQRVLMKMKEQKDRLDDSSFFKSESKAHKSDDTEKMQHFLFDRLCPLLIVRLLPLKVFDDLNSSIVYGPIASQSTIYDSGYGEIDIIDHECVVGFLISRAFLSFEFEDVRKLAAELCGRIHPKVLFPVVCTQLQEAVGSQDILKIKACIFSLCTSLVIRGRDPNLNRIVLNIRKNLEKVLSWPSLEGDEVSKAQHGCIDCLALMICSELQAPDMVKYFTTKKNDASGSDGNSTLAFVMNWLIDMGNELFSPSEGPVKISFQLCMANVLISACQKVSGSGKKSFARKVLPHLIRSVETIEVSEIRAACVQVLFSAVYHLKSAILPYSSDLLGLALRSLRTGSEKEKMAGAKLVASLMASEDAILESISGGLLEARSVLSSIISPTDLSPDVQKVCQKLLQCITT